VVERALAAADAAEIEPQHRESAVHEGIIELVDDSGGSSTAELGVRMEHECNRRVFDARRMIPALDPAGRTVKMTSGHQTRLGRLRSHGLNVEGSIYGALDGNELGARNFLELF